MEETSSTKKEESPRKLNEQDQQLFEHWRKTFTTFSLYSTNEPVQSTTSTSTTPDPTFTKSTPGEANSSLTQRQHTGCINLVNKLFEKSPIIIFLNSELKKVGCSPPVYCAPCPQRVHGGFHPAFGITICQNHIPSKRRMESTLAHEMMHAFDECRFKVDYRNIKHIACGEVLPRGNVSSLL